MVDYKELGFKCGIEIHQQLEGKKLFCSCPTINSTKKPDFEIRRKLRAVAGETGKVDKAAAHEMSKEKEYIYVGNSEDVCNVELDDEPPHSMNKDALEVALQVSMLLKAKIVSEIQVMRKTVVDGSNVSGFQRTALVATDGYVETPKGKVGVPLICLEEEAAQKLEDAKEHVKYKLDRLGIPLIEIGTDASIQDPEHAKEVASYLGMVLRSTEKVKRGIGTIRQDVNVSIKGGARTEIKGFQELKSIPKVIEYEVNRQISELKKGKKIEQSVRKAETDMTTSFLRPMPGAARMYPETDVSPVVISKDILKKIKVPELLTEKAVKIEKEYGLSPELAREIMGNKLFYGFVKKFKKVEAQFIAHTIVNIPKEIKTRLKLDPDKITDKDFDEVLGYLNDGKVEKSAVLEMLAEVCKGNKIEISKYKSASDDELKKDIEKIVASKPGLNPGGYMGLIMAKYRGKVDGKKVMDILKGLLK